MQEAQLQNSDNIYENWNQYENLFYEMLNSDYKHQLYQNQYNVMNQNQYVTAN